MGKLAEGILWDSAGDFDKTKDRTAELLSRVPIVLAVVVGRYMAFVVGAGVGWMIGRGRCWLAMSVVVLMS